MFKFWIPAAGLFIFVGMSFFQQSTIPDHNVFISDKESMYEDIKNDRAFGRATAFFITSIIPQIKNKFNRGEYLIKRQDSAYSIIIKIITGDMVIRKMTIPEGYTVQMIVEKLNNQDSLIGEIKDMPEEGALFPSTYFYKKNDTKISIIKKMKNQMESITKKLFNQKQLQNKIFINKTMIMASIIEKESKNIKERSLISSVFKNRLEKNMRLQSDPTIIYAMSKGYGKITRQLTRADLFFQSPYNTYRNKGLPPTPICCPSKESIIAALNPASTNFLYFVATPDNEAHVFAKEYTEHLKNIKQRKNKLPLCEYKTP